MAYRPTWQGHLKLSLVTCPVALYTATNPGGDVHFHLINPKTNNRIKMITTDPETGPIERQSLVKGYEVSKGEYILLTDEEIKSVKLESTKTIDIERFVPGDEIDRIYWDNPYYLAPDGKMAQEAFGVIRTAMEKSGQIALGRIVMATRERILALEPRGKGILAYTIRSDAEVRKPDEIFDGISDTRADPAMIAIARERLPDVPLHVARMQDFTVEGRFAIVQCLFSSIGYVADENELQATIARFAGVVERGGDGGDDCERDAVARGLIDHQARVLSRHREFPRRGEILR